MLERPDRREMRRLRLHDIRKNVSYWRDKALAHRAAADGAEASDRIKLMAIADTLEACARDMLKWLGDG